MSNSENQLTLQWERPKSAEFPKIWHTFRARDICGDNLVEYRMQDLTPDRADDYIDHFMANFVPDEPVARAVGVLDDPHAAGDYKRAWAPIIAQRMPLVCFKEGSDEIVGGNMVFISTKGDTFPYKLRRVVSHMKQE